LYICKKVQDALDNTTSFLTESAANNKQAVISSLVIFGYASVKSSTVSPDANYSRIKSTKILVLLITGLP
jgi:hypothetical protein